MRIRALLLLVVVVVPLSFSVAACTSTSDDDDDGGFNTPTPTPTITGTPTPTATPTPFSGPAITERASFVAAGGDEIWLCFESRFEGTIENIATDDASGTCSAQLESLALTATPEYTTFNTLMIDGLTCGVGSHDWYFDYKITNDPRCPEGCVNKVYDFAMAADDAFGTICGSSGVPALTALSAYQSPTTNEHRFTATAGTLSSVTIAKLRIYAQGGGSLLTECTATATINSGGTGLFDTTCVPVVALTPTTTYSALIFGSVFDGEGFSGRMDFGYVATPAP